MKTELVVYPLLVLLLLLIAWVVFKRMIRGDYRVKGHLTLVSALLELFVFAGLMCLPFLFNPPEWAWFWQYSGSTGYGMWLVGLALVISGFVIAFGTMAWFGLWRAFGLEVEGLICKGPYRITRNPQIIGGYLMVIGITFQWPSWYSVVWIFLYGIICHWMIVSEEEHLLAIYGSEYRIYSQKTPRYLFKKSNFRNDQQEST